MARYMGEVVASVVMCAFVATACSAGSTDRSRASAQAQKTLAALRVRSDSADCQHDSATGLAYTCRVHTSGGATVTVHVTRNNGAWDAQPVRGLVNGKDIATSLSRTFSQRVGQSVLVDCAAVVAVNTHGTFACDAHTSTDPRTHRITVVITDDRTGAFTYRAT
jgi:hypothetical protein